MAMRMYFLPRQGVQQMESQHRMENRAPRQRVAKDEYESGYADGYNSAMDDYEAEQRVARQIGYRGSMRAEMRTKGKGKKSEKSEMMGAQEDYLRQGQNFLQILEETFSDGMPETWEEYGTETKDRLKILEMEMEEVKKSLKDPEKVCTEIMHLVGAAFYLLKGIEEEDE